MIDDFYLTSIQKCIVLHLQHEKGDWAILFEALLNDVQQLLETPLCRDASHYRVLVIGEELPVKSRVGSPRTIYLSSP